jgi:hypothetical protein
MQAEVQCARVVKWYLCINKSKAHSTQYSMYRKQSAINIHMCAFTCVRLARGGLSRLRCSLRHLCRSPAPREGDHAVDGGHVRAGRRHHDVSVRPRRRRVRNGELGTVQ